ncbi:squamous cell carcinoma antigen recognized by T-cells 3 isoform X1 [Phthorimaea operculella]|nr:squamous cell carcinoma antigen recognized by T-cells 3 isoform X1 [Phthorimaea operculella]
MAIVEDEVRNESEEENEIEVVVEEDDGDQDSDDSDDDADEEDILEQKVIELECRIAQDPYNYDDHIDLIQSLWGLSELERWRAAFDRLQQLFLLKPEHWLLRIQTEVTLGHSAESRANIANLFQQAALDCYSIPILSEWCTWALSGTLVEAREQLDEILTRAGADPLSGKLFWDARLELEKSQLDAMSEADADFKSQQESVLWCLEESAARPLLRAEEAWPQLQAMASAIKDDKYLEKAQKQHEAALDYLQKISHYEDKILSTENVEEKCVTYQEYIDTVKELSRDDKYAECDSRGILKVLYDRATTECLSCSASYNLLLSYARHVEKYSSRKTHARVLDACTRRCPRRHTFWALVMQAKQRDGQSADDIKSVFETALSKGMESYKEAESLWLSYLEYIRRQTDFDKESDVERLRKTFRLAWDSLAEAWGDEANDCEVPLYWARLEYKRINDPKAGKEIFEEIFKYGDNKSMSKYWEALISLESSRKPAISEHKLRDLFRRALKFVGDYPPGVARLWTDYERDYGGLETSVECAEACEWNCGVEGDYPPSVARLWTDYERDYGGLETSVECAEACEWNCGVEGDYPPGVARLWTDYERDYGGLETSVECAEACEVYSNTNQLRDIFCKSLIFVGDYQPGVARLWTDYERDFGGLETSVECAEACEVYLNTSQLRYIFCKSLKFVGDYPPGVARLWTDYERDYGGLETSVECAEACEAKIKEWRDNYQAMKDKMTGNKHKGKQQNKQLNKKGKFDSKKKKKDDDAPQPKTGKDKDESRKGKRKSDHGSDGSEVKRKRDADMDTGEADSGGGVKRAHDEDETETAMIGREDREDALLKSALQADERVRVVSEHLTECLMLLEEAPNPEDKELVEGDVSQCLELAQDIEQAAADISRRRDGKEKPFRGKVGQGLQVPLPPVTVPVFAGDYADWPAFEDLYSSVVHTRTDITPAYKMAQLMSRLHGEPHELLTHLAVSDSNYEVAWKILTDRYRNKRLIVDRLQRRGQRTGATGFASGGLRLYLGPHSASPPAERNGRSIRAAPWGKSSDHLPTYEDLKSFLEAESRRVDVQAGEAPRKETSAPRHPERPGAPARGGNSRQPRRYNTALESGCAYCRETGHGVTACQEFAAQRVQRRRGVAQQRRWCFRCLGPHQVRVPFKHQL